MPSHPEFRAGLEPNAPRPQVLYVSPGQNLTWPENEQNISYHIRSACDDIYPHEERKLLHQVYHYLFLHNNDTSQGIWWPWCDYWKEPQHVMYQLANVCFVLAYSSSSSRKGMLFMHCCLIVGWMLFSTWAWNIICAPDVFTWNFAFMLMNLAQVFHILYQLRPVKFDPELEEIYHTLFEPFKLDRAQFKRMVSSDFAEIMSLHAGEAYAIQNLTRTDRLGLLISGKVTVFADNQFLHPIMPCEFLDSPEFESSRNTIDDKFNVAIVAASSCRYLFWQRCALEYLFVKDPYIATVLTTLIARDITTKLYAMNNKIVTAKGSHLDIRLPSITSSLTATGEYRSPIRRTKRANGAVCNSSMDAYVNTNKKKLKEMKMTGGGDTCGEMTPLAELPSTDDLTLSNDVESWLETSSKYHSCELVDAD